MTFRSHLWSDLTRAEIAAARDAGALVVIPVGSIEQHSDHLPVATDSLTAGRISQMAAEACAYPVLVAPTVAFAFSPHHGSWPGTLTISLATFAALLEDVTASIARAGFKRQLLVNGHGGNRAPLMSIAAEFVTSGREVGYLDYFAPSAADIAGILKGPSGVTHAGEAETSLVMALEKDDAAKLAFYRERAAGLEPRRKSEGGGNPKFISAAGAWWPSLYPAGDIGYNGDPGLGSVETGDRLIAAIVDKLSAFFAAFAVAEVGSGGMPPR